MMKANNSFWSFIQIMIRSNFCSYMMLVDTIEPKECNNLQGLGRKKKKNIRALLTTSHRIIQITQLYNTLTPPSYSLQPQISSNIRQFPEPWAWNSRKVLDKDMSIYLYLWFIDRLNSPSNISSWWYLCWVGWRSLGPWCAHSSHGIIFMKITQFIPFNCSYLLGVRDFCIYSSIISSKTRRN